jgi:hypothetical protein
MLVRAGVTVGGARAPKKVIVGIFLALGLHAARAEAEPPATPLDDAPERGRYVLTMRPLSIGLGGGNLGFGGRYGGAAEYWVTDDLGFGLDGGASTQIKLFDASSSAVFIGPTLGVRTAPRGGYFIATLGAGYATVSRSIGSGLCFTDSCAPVQNASYDGYSIRTAVGWLGHPGGQSLELGPVLRLDAVGAFRGEAPTDFLVTLNFELGFALLRR